MYFQNPSEVSQAQIQAEIDALVELEDESLRRYAEIVKQESDRNPWYYSAWAVDPDNVPF